MTKHHLTASLAAKRQHFDRQLKAILHSAEEEKFTIYCREGCGNCCRLAVNCSFPEAADIAQQLTAQQQSALTACIPRLQMLARNATDLKNFLQFYREQMKGCPFLTSTKQSCSIYNIRPLSCRALLSTRPSDWCGVDFSNLHPLEKKAYLSSLNPEIVSFPTHYLKHAQELGSELETTTLAEMGEHYGVNLGGSLIYQVWLELEYNLSEWLEKNSEKARKIIRREEQNQPFLLHYRIFYLNQ